MPGLSLATLGVLATAGLVGLVAHLLLGIGWTESFLLGAIVSSTDAAAVFFLLRAGGINLRERVRATLEVESSSNDPMAIFLTFALVQLIVASESGGARRPRRCFVDFVEQIGLGIVLGLLGGYAIRLIIDRTDLDIGLYPIIFLSLALAVFAATSLLGGSGFLAVYIAGIFAGNTKMRHAVGLRKFSQALTWLGQIVMFLTLGLLASPSEFLDLIWPAVGIAAFLMIVAGPRRSTSRRCRSASVVAKCAFTGWVGLRGAVSILLGIVPLISGVEDGKLFFNVAFIVVLGVAAGAGLVHPPGGALARPHRAAAFRPDRPGRAGIAGRRRA